MGKVIDGVYIPNKADGTERKVPKKKILGPIAYVKKLKAIKAQKVKNAKNLETRQKMFNKFKELYGFIEHINKSLGNRGARKKFWSGFIKNSAVADNVFTNMINSAKPDPNALWLNVKAVQLSEANLVKALKNKDAKQEEIATIVKYMRGISIKEIIR